MTETTTGAFDSAAPWTLNPMVSLRNEEFGALAYHHGNRRLVFLKSRTLVDLVTRLDQYDSAHDALIDVVPEAQRSRYLGALVSLAGSEVVRGR